MPVTKPVKRVLLRNQVLEQLRQQIVQGELAPGERIIELSIAKQMDISQAPVREALQSLALEGLVEMRDHRGAVVADLILKDMHEIFQVRAVIEALAVKRVLNASGQIDVEHLEEQLFAMRKGALQNNLAFVVDADINFHRTIVSWANHPNLLHLWNTSDVHIRRFIFTVHPKYFSLDEIAETHVPMIETLKTGDANAAAKVFQEHLEIIWSKLSHSTADSEAK